jgi:hypothetical protein
VGSIASFENDHVLGRYEEKKITNQKKERGEKKSLLLW